MNPCNLFNCRDFCFLEGEQCYTRLISRKKSNNTHYCTKIYYICTMRVMFAQSLSRSMTNTQKRYQ